MRGHWLLMCVPALLILAASPGCSSDGATDGGGQGDTPGEDAGNGGSHKDSGTSKDGSSGGHHDSSTSGDDDAGGGNTGDDDDASTGDDDDDATTGDDDATTAQDSGNGGHDSSTGHDSGSSATGCDDPNLVWKKAEKTEFTSYPAPGSAECIQYSGCDYEGEFAACSGAKPESWVKTHNIVSVFPKFSTLKLHDLCLRSGSHVIRATVLDECADSDCSGCCTQNAKPSGNLIDIESYTAARFGVDDGQIEFADMGPTTTGGCN